jgi:hypothetical protein
VVACDIVYRCAAEARDICNLSHVLFPIRGKMA